MRICQAWEFRRAQNEMPYEKSHGNKGVAKYWREVKNREATRRLILSGTRTSRAILPVSNVEEVTVELSDVQLNFLQFLKERRAGLQN